MRVNNVLEREMSKLSCDSQLSCDSALYSNFQQRERERERERVQGNFNIEIELCILNMLQFHKFPI